ncbi:MAG TPA: DUF1499 domain-containing protein [Halioglobus sp.]
MNQQHGTPSIVNRTGYIAVVLLLVLPLSVVVVRSGAWQSGLLLYAVASVGSVLLLILSIILLLLPRFAPWRKGIALRLLPALPGTVLLFSLIAGGRDTPPIHDITTDTSDPPLFAMAAQQRGEAANSLAIDLHAIEQQQHAYPDLKTLVSPLSVDDAYGRAVQVATKLGWEIYHQDRSNGVIEAVDSTRIMGFKDDVVIRIRSSDHGSLLDLRSVSRVGGGDIGANAKRIRAFREAFQQPG